jgi:hypothetical protein
MIMKSTIMRTFVGVAAAMLVTGSAQAQSLLVNGDFETGNFSGWSTTVQPGSDGGLFVNPTGHAAPLSGFFVYVEPENWNYYALTDQRGPGSYALTQSFHLGSASKVHVTFDMSLQNGSGVTAANGRDFTTTSPNQNATVDILRGGADPLTDDPSDIVGILFGPGSAPIGWQTYDQDLILTAGTYSFRFAETDNRGVFQAGLDNVVVTSTPSPEPASWVMMLGGFGLVGGAMRRRRSVMRPC